MSKNNPQRKFKNKQFTFLRKYVRGPLKQGTGGCNPCYKPSSEANREDLREWRKEDLKLRRATYKRDTPDRQFAYFVPTKNSDPAYRKSFVRERRK